MVDSLTLKCDLRAFVLHLRTFDFMPLHLVTVTLFTSSNTSGSILSKLFKISNISIISPLILHLSSENTVFHCLNRSSYDELHDVGMCFISVPSPTSFVFLCSLVTRIKSLILDVTSQIPYTVFSLLLEIYDKTSLKLYLTSYSLSFSQLCTEHSLWDYY